MSAVPRVSIGLPVFNLERTVARAIESVLGQTLTDFELVVSDNASTDGTGEICRRYASVDSRIRLIRQPRTTSAYDNFRVVLQAARAEYFMWLSGDDYALPSLLAACVDVLDARPEVVCCVPRVDFLEADGVRRAAGGTFALLGTPADNLCRFLDDPMDNSRLYGLHRRPILQATMPPFGYHAFDWVISARSLMAGTHGSSRGWGSCARRIIATKYTRCSTRRSRPPSPGCCRSPRSHARCCPTREPRARRRCSTACCA